MTAISQHSLEESAPARLRGSLPDATADHEGDVRRRLRRRLVLLDCAALLGAWCTMPLSAAPELEPRTGLVVVVIIAVSIALLMWQRLYRAHTCAVRSLEVVRLGRVAVLAAVAGLLAGWVLHADVAPVPVALHAGLAFALLVAGRGVYRSWLRVERASGRHIRTVAVVGMNDDALSLIGLLVDEADLGYRVAGVFCDRYEMPEDCPVGWLGPSNDILATLERGGIGGVILVATALDPDVRNILLQTLAGGGVDTQVSIGLERVECRRLRAVPVAHEPTFFVEPRRPQRPRLAMKRLFDVVVGALALVAAMPIIAFAAVAIVLTDGRPILYRQVRVGRDGRRFHVLKLRTMYADAEKQLHLLHDQNERTGPLFKIAEDPRITKVGRLLRGAGLDELPQLWNVLRGEMSLVGPRPPLPREVEEFDEELLERFRMRPGITGLWQVEARDNPSFRMYRHLDLFYVENWSLGLDLGIILATVEMMAKKLVVNRLPTRSTAPDDRAPTYPVEQLRPVEGR